jgi:NAD(P)-dependent dehydrogenase (short-subunit alcohol dehydrogenase family)
MNSSDTVVVIGGSSGMGLAVARRCLADGASVVIAGRSGERLEAAQAELGCPGRLRAVTADIGDRAQVAALFKHTETVRHVVVTAADLPYGPVKALTEDSLMRAVRSKFLGPFFAAQEAAPRMPAGGSITFTSGIAAYRPAPGGSLAASVNGALESMVRAFALAPLADDEVPSQIKLSASCRGQPVADEPVEFSCEVAPGGGERAALG